MKKLICAALVATLTVALVGCGTQKDDGMHSDFQTTTGSENVAGYNPMDYVVLGQYKGLQINLTGSGYGTDDAALQEFINQSLIRAGLFVKDESLVVYEDSIVNVDYVGSKNGVPFDGGSATDVFLDIAAGGDAVSGTKYIDGFCDDLVGHHVGETVDCKLSFPDNYGAADLAGQEVVFTDTINYIARVIKVSELDDETVSEKLGFSSVDEFLKASQDNLVDYAQYNIKEDTQTAVMDTIMTNCTVSGVPEGVVNYRVNGQIQMYAAMYESAGMDFETACKKYYNMTQSQFAQAMAQKATDSLKQELIFEAIAQNENIEVSDEEYNEFLQAALARTNSQNPEDLYNMYNQGYISGEEYMRYMCLLEKTMRFCVDSAIVSY